MRRKRMRWPLLGQWWILEKNQTAVLKIQLSKFDAFSFAFFALKQARKQMSIERAQDKLISIERAQDKQMSIERARDTQMIIERAQDQTQKSAQNK